jgi:hypothetical protein
MGQSIGASAQEACVPRPGTLFEAPRLKSVPFNPDYAPLRHLRQMLWPGSSNRSASGGDTRAAAWLPDGTRLVLRSVVADRLEKDVPQAGSELGPTLFAAIEHRPNLWEWMHPAFQTSEAASASKPGIDGGKADLKSARSSAPVSKWKLEKEEMDQGPYSFESPQYRLIYEEARGDATLRMAFSTRSPFRVLHPASKVHCPLACRRNLLHLVELQDQKGLNGQVEFMPLRKFYTRYRLYPPLEPPRTKGPSMGTLAQCLAAKDSRISLKLKKPTSLPLHSQDQPKVRLTCRASVGQTWIVDYQAERAERCPLRDYDAELPPGPVTVPGPVAGYMSGTGGLY